jgi:glycerophosphoryl diester phosphodiesterase
MDAVPDRPERSPRISRRSLLAGAVGSLALAAAGCHSGPPARPAPPATVAGLVSANPFYVAHRGGGDNWPEMTAYAYDQCALLPGLQAIEISVCLTSDGVLVCSHDADTIRMTGTPYEIAKQPWSVLAPLMVTAAYTLDPTQPARPFSRFDEVIEKHIGQLVAFVEPKVPQAVAPLMAKLASLGQPERVVWKQPVNQPNFVTAKSHGFGTWGYVLDEPSHTGDRLQKFAAAPEIDMLGVQRTETDGFVRTVVDAANRNGKKTITWAIRNAEDRARALRLGCVGLMTSNIAQVPAIPL